MISRGGTVLCKHRNLNNFAVSMGLIIKYKEIKIQHVFFTRKDT